MASEIDVLAVQRVLSDGIQKITSLSPGCESAELAAFSAFRLGVVRAASCVRLGAPSEVLDDLEPKDVVLTFLLGLHERRRVYRRQIAEVLSVLSETAWLGTLKGNTALWAWSPSELVLLVDDEDAPIEEDLALAPTTKAKPAVPVETAFALELFRRAQGLLEKIDYSADDKDDAQEAFERVRKAIMRLAKAPGPDSTVDQLEPKDRILNFLVDFLSRSHKYRSRVSSLLLCLRGFDDWKAATDRSVHAAVRELPADLSQPKRLTVVRNGNAVNLGGAANMAFKHGKVGALYVRVRAAYNLSADSLGRSPDPYVRVICAGKMKRTHTIGHQIEPRWQSLAFMFEVPTLDSIIKFEVLDNHLFKDKLLGSVSLIASNSPRVPGFHRHALGTWRDPDEEHGELELELVFMAGQPPPADPVVSVEEASGSFHAVTPPTKRREDLPDQASTKRASLRASVQRRSKGASSYSSFSSSRRATMDSWFAPGNGKPASSLTFDVPNEGTKKPLRCPAGHLVDDCKDGLRWHEGHIGILNLSNCDLCDLPLERDDIRWQCSNKRCRFNVCADCHKDHVEPPPPQRSISS